MSYMNTWKNKMTNNGGSSTKAIRKNADRIYSRRFKDSNAYRSATIVKSDTSESDIDIRVVNKDINPNEKKLYLKPNTRVDIGSYIKYIEEDNEGEMDITCLVLSVEKNLESPCCNAEICNQTLQVTEDVSFGIVASDDSYGSKTQLNNEFVGSIDNKLKVEIQNNSITRQIMPDYRFILNNSPTDIFKVMDRKTSVTPGVIVWICKKDDYKPEYDDLENNLAWNGETITPEPTDYEILGEDSVRVNNSYTYTLSPTSTNTSWSLDDFTINNNIAEINIIDDNTVIVKGLKSGEYFELTCEVDGKQIIKEIMVVR